MQILHNNRCRKSREALQLLNTYGIEPEIIDYLKNTPSARELSEILRKLQMKPTEIIRTGETLYKNVFKGKELSDEQWIQVMVENPILIERPIIIKGDRAVIGRPPENVKELL